MPLKQRLIALGLGRLEEYVLSGGKHGGLPSLTRRASKDFWEAALEEHQDAIPVVSPKTFYVTTKTRPAHLRLFLQATAWYLNTHFGPNDGMVALEDQSVDGVGTVLAVLDAGHTDLTHRFPRAMPRRRLRRADRRHHHERRATGGGELNVQADRRGYATAWLSPARLRSKLGSTAWAIASPSSPPPRK